MPTPPTPEPRPAATSLVPTSAGRRSETHRSGAHEAAPRVTRLWEAIRRTRLELEARVRRDDWIGARFETLIRPREQAFTAAVCRLTEHLVAHHECTALGADERSLLGLWIDENLQSLATHPFAPRESRDALAARWRGHLDTRSHPLDVALASLHARGRGAAERDPERPDPDEAAARAGAAGGADRDGDATGRRADSRAGERRGEEREGPRGSRGGERRGARDGPSPDGRDERDGAARPDPDRLVARLFRRLARVLHPDREPDEARRRDKHALMSDCLRAREERDIDTLLSLYVAHVGALPADVVEDDPAELAELLRRQLRALQGRLHRHLARGDLSAMIVERYAARDRGESERRFAAHARALDGETGRVAALADGVADAGGLRDALLARRARELDRLAIDELTGVANG